MYFSEYWTQVLTVTGFIGAITKFYIDWLRIRELRFKVKEAETKKLQDESTIIIPDLNEIRKYGFKNFIKESSKTNLLFFIIFFGISFGLYRTNSSHELDRRAFNNSAGAATSRIHELLEEIELLRKLLPEESPIRLGETEIQAFKIESGRRRPWGWYYDEDEISEFIKTNAQPIATDGRELELIEIRTHNYNEFVATFSSINDNSIHTFVYLFEEIRSDSYVIVIPIDSED